MAADEGADDDAGEGADEGAGKDSDEDADVSAVAEKDAAPVIAIDGPSGVGKGTIAARLAARLGWHLLDSGALYRIVAYAALQEQTALDDADALTARAADLDLSFLAATDSDAVRVLLDGTDVTAEIRSDAAGQAASRVAALPTVRTALIARQRANARAPGLVADGRDMGTVVFPSAPLKIYLTASAEARAERRHKQLMAKGVAASLRDLFESIRDRDARDMARTVAPLKPAEDALVLDTTDLDVDAVYEAVFAQVRERGLSGTGAPQG